MNRETRRKLKKLKNKAVQLPSPANNAPLKIGDRVRLNVKAIKSCTFSKKAEYKAWIDANARKVFTLSARNRNPIWWELKDGDEDVLWIFRDDHLIKVEAD